jgi:hypothetical protein
VNLLRQCLECPNLVSEMVGLRKVLEVYRKWLRHLLYRSGEAFETRGRNRELEAMSNGERGYVLRDFRVLAQVEGRFEEEALF